MIEAMATAMRQARSYIPLLLLAALIPSCAPRALHVMDPANDQQLIIQHGQKLSVTLESPLANAYMWDVCALDDTILRYDDRTIEEPDSMHIQEVLTFTGMQPGETSLALAYGFPSSCLLSSYQPERFLVLTVVVE